MKIQKKSGDLLRRVSKKKYHMIFIASLFTLTLLVAWWAVFINQSIDQVYQLRYERALMAQKSAGQPVGRDSNSGSLERNTDTREGMGTESRLEDGNSPGQYFDEEYLEEIENQRKRQRIMVIGESGLLMVLILVSGLMILRMVWLEKRTTEELHGLWSRLSHEIKTPITGLRVFLETLRQESLTRAEMVPLIDLALKQVDRQRKLAENMLIGQKLKKDSVHIKAKSLDLSRFVQAFFDDHLLQHASNLTNRITIQAEKESGIQVRGDKEALHVIFDNIVDNAAKYAGESLQLNVEIKRTPKHALVIFRDNGPGFDPGMEKMIFQSYGRLDDELPVGKHGTGMGLYISRQLARKIGGDLKASSDGPGRGACFTLYLLRETEQ